MFTAQVAHKLLKMRATYTRRSPHLFTLETWLVNALGDSQPAEVSLRQPETADSNLLLDNAKFEIQKSRKSKSESGNIHKSKQHTYTEHNTSHIRSCFIHMS